MLNVIAKKTFESKKIQDSWKVHVNAFGSILENAFKEDYKTRIDVCAALNLISNRKLQEGYQKVGKLYDSCKCNDDYALFYFLLGLCFDMANQEDQMAAAYMKCCEYEPDFYMPYIKTAKFAHKVGDYDVAANLYEGGLNILTQQTQDEQTKVLIASIFVNFSTCLTLMHQYEMALELMNKSKMMKPVMIGRSASEAMLYAALGRKEQYEACLKQIQTETPQVYEHVKKESDAILNGKHPHFNKIDPNKDDIEAFWVWFKNNHEQLYPLFMSKDETKYPIEFIEKINEVMPYVEKQLEYHVEFKEDKVIIILHDGYSMSKTHGLIQLLNSAPKDLRANFGFEVRR